MTNKQIKDGIDVSQCKCYSVEDNSCNNTLSGSCMKEKCQIFRLLQAIKTKEEECKRLKWYLEEIRDDELKSLDIEWDEYETHCVNTEYSNIINLVEEALEERSPEDCRYNS